MLPGLKKIKDDHMVNFFLFISSWNTDLCSLFISVYENGHTFFFTIVLTEELV